MVAADVEEIRSLIDEGKLIIGTDRTLKALRNGKVKKVFLSSNVSENSKSEIVHLAKIADVDVVDVDESNEELGVLCRKPFAVSVCAA